MLTIAIIGRPNVGKSTLFNRLAGCKIAIASNIAGTTRDRREGKASLAGMKLKIIDTAGLDEEIAGLMKSRQQTSDIKKIEVEAMVQTEFAIADADLVLFVIDGRAGVTPMDKHFANWLRKKSNNVITVANKCESKAEEQLENQIYSLGFGEAVAISAEHGDGVVDLASRIIPYYDQYQQNFASLAELEDKKDIIKLAVVGRPNVGKSTLLNKMIGSERLVTSPVAGTTRDSISIDWRLKDGKYNNQSFRLIDTAGIRRKANVTELLEKESLLDSFRAIRFSDIVLLLIDSSTGVDAQDLAIADMASREGRALIIIANKLDLIPSHKVKAALLEIEFRIAAGVSSLKGLTVVPISAMNDKSFDHIARRAIKLYRLWNHRIDTSQLNQWLKIAIEENPPPAHKARGKIKLKFATQGKTRPPTIYLFTNFPDAVPENYLRYLVNSFRLKFNMPAVPIRLILRKSGNHK